MLSGNSIVVSNDLHELSPLIVYLHVAFATVSLDSEYCGPLPGVKWWKQRVGVRMLRVGRAIPGLLWGVPQCSSAMAPVPAVGVW